MAALSYAWRTAHMRYRPNRATNGITLGHDVPTGLADSTARTIGTANAAVSQCTLAPGRRSTRLRNRRTSASTANEAARRSDISKNVAELRVADRRLPAPTTCTRISAGLTRQRYRGRNRVRWLRAVEGSAASSDRCRYRTPASGPSRRRQSTAMRPRTGDIQVTAGRLDDQVRARDCARVAITEWISRRRS